VHGGLEDGVENKNKAKAKAKAKKSGQPPTLFC